MTRKGFIPIIGAVAIVAVLFILLGGANLITPATIWFRDVPGTMHAGSPDTIVFTGYPARTYSLDRNDVIYIYGSYYAYGDSVTCERVGGVMDTAAICLLNGALPSIDYMVDSQGNTYTNFAIVRGDIEIYQNYGYVPSGMTWYMKTSVTTPVVPEPDKPVISPPVIGECADTVRMCGGPCPPCPDDTPSPTGSCFDLVQNQGEEGVDCGGPCPRTCAGLDEPKTIIDIIIDIITPEEPPPSIAPDVPPAEPAPTPPAEPGTVFDMLIELIINFFKALGVIQ